MEFSGEKICPRCGGLVLNKARFCIICGLKVKGMFPAENKTRKCPHCKRSNEDADKFCIYCGERF
jgi:RNA polymerase subunit RPABC4/transcription elongation factor Spt4